MNHPASYHFDAFSFTNKTTNLKPQGLNLRQPLAPNLYATEKRKKQNYSFTNSKQKAAVKPS